MAQVLGEAVLELRTDQKGLDKGLATGKAKVQKMSRSMTSLGKKLTVGLTAPLVAFAAVGVKMASDLGESMNKASVVFGDAMDVVKDFADTSATQFGISEQKALEYAGTLGTILTASGLSEDATADMSVAMVQLSADIASFNNLPIDVAMEKLRAGLVGEVEPLRTVGVLLNQAAVEAKAVEMGLIAAGDEMTEAVKVQARFAVITEQTELAQSDFQRTSGDLANSMRILKAVVADVAADLFTALIPAVTRSVQAIRDAVTWFRNLSDPMKNTILVTGGVVVVLGPLLIALGQVVRAITTLAPLMIALASGPAAPFVLLAAAAATLAILIATHWDEIKDFTMDLVDSVSMFFRTLHNDIKASVDRIVKIVPDIYQAIKEWLVDKLTALISPITTAWNTIVRIFQTGTDQVAKATDTISSQAKSGMQHGGIISTPSLLVSGVGDVARVAEKGIEAVLPLTRLPSGDLGVKASGQGAGGTVINFDLHFADSVITSQETARRLLIPVIEEAAEKVRTTIALRD